jgi:hypothetical protein
MTPSYFQGNDANKRSGFTKEILEAFEAVAKKYHTSFVVRANYKSTKGTQLNYQPYSPKMTSIKDKTSAEPIVNGYITEDPQLLEDKDFSQDTLIMLENKQLFLIPFKINIQFLLDGLGMHPPLFNINLDKDQKSLIIEPTTSIAKYKIEFPTKIIDGKNDVKNILTELNKSGDKLEYKSYYQINNENYKPLRVLADVNKIPIGRDVDMLWYAPAKTAKEMKHNLVLEDEFSKTYDLTSHNKNNFADSEKLLASVMKMFVKLNPPENLIKDPDYQSKFFTALTRVLGQPSVTKPRDIYYATEISMRTTKQPNLIQHGAEIDNPDKKIDLDAGQPLYIVTENEKFFCEDLKSFKSYLQHENYFAKYQVDLPQKTNWQSLLTSTSNIAQKLGVALDIPATEVQKPKANKTETTTEKQDSDKNKPLDKENIVIINTPKT